MSAWFRSSLLFPALFLVLCSVALPGMALATDIGRVIALIPGVMVVRDGQKLPLALKDAVKLHDVIQSDATGRAQIIFADDSTVSIAPRTSLDMREFANEGSGSTFKAHIGQGLARIITGRVVEQNPAGFAVTTPEATVGIRGTILLVRTENGKTTVYLENSMRRQVFVNSVLLPQGYKITVPHPDSRPELMTPADRDELRAETAITAASSGSAGALLAGSTLPLEGVTQMEDLNLPMHTLADNLTGGGKPGLTTGTVEGSLTSGVLTGFSGSFSFDVNLGSGAVSNAAMSGSGTDSFSIPVSYGVSGGSGTFGGFISGFTGTAYSSAAPFSISASDPTTLLITGSVANVGSTVSGNYEISASSSGWANVDSGTATGSRTK